MEVSFDSAPLKRALLLYCVLFGIFGVVAARMPLSADLPPSLFTAWLGACVGIALDICCRACRTP